MDDLLNFSGEIKQLAKHYSEQSNYLELLTNETEADSGEKGSAIATDLNSAEEGEKQPGHAAELLQDGNLLWFSGSIENYVYFVLKITGLEHHQASQIGQPKVLIRNRPLVQVSVAYDSLISGQTVRHAAFRTKNDADVPAIHRQTFRSSRATFFCWTPERASPSASKDERAFSIIKGVPDTSPLKSKKVWIAIGLATAMISTQIASGAADGLPGIHQSVHRGDHYGGADASKRLLKTESRHVTALTAFAFAFLTAIEAGCRESRRLLLTSSLTSVSDAIGGKAAAFVANHITTAFLTEIVRNNVAGALMYPIAARLVGALGVVPSRVTVVVMLGASAGFTLPYRYKTNLMVCR
ncbi:Vacuolar protein sorting-associated protein [Klebsormidium nitens]|uniref:Vacuolar protein sorting-associated protein n=1 Tax=Klebsormidium nitens TaxID=105231 RepID=A0A1Y1INB8_KLENI|nr:Vacuolar protein sorting-associated protein [Klebsormidium nitens]|eukprot:GAQ92380.1 Vacuolar protein sorting-associated protein [Klebsormidium nitens]